VAFAIAAALLAGAALLVVAGSTDWLAAFGASAAGERRHRVRRSPRWRDGRFHNVDPTRTILHGGLPTMLHLQLRGKEIRYPRRAIPVEARRTADYESPPASGLRATWIGHATVLVEIAGRRVLTDPVWSERVSPSTLVGPRRFFAPPIALDALPPIDAVVISHDHYDHLDMATVRALARRGTIFLVPLGVGAHLERWGIPAAQTRELDWGETVRLDPVTFTIAPSRHFSGRGLRNRDTSLWSSWVIASDRSRVYCCGDSGYFGGFRDIGRDLGPFDVTLISTGAYSPIWPLIHMTPEEVVQAHVDLRGRLLVPIHWGTFNLAFHDWNEPAVRASAAASARGVPILLPRPGGMVEPGRAGSLATDDWWRAR
jgi:L-ascorbate metabolism protein UlaG (beta-lactamase superfamily)